jgi:hypothetical protein
MSATFFKPIMALASLRLAKRARKMLARINPERLVVSLTESSRRKPNGMEWPRWNQIYQIFIDSVIQ